MKVLVLGNGFIGNAIVNRFVSEGNEVLVYSRTKRKTNKYDQVAGNIFDPEGLDEVLKWGPKLVIHTAWITTPGMYREDPLNFDYKQFAIHLASKIAFSPVEHLVVLGTCAEYGHITSPSKAGFTPLNPNSIYGQQKVEAFQEVARLMANSNCRLTWARIFYPYGPHQDERRLIPQLIKAIKTQQDFTLDDTTSIYDWITTRDIASAIFWITQNKLPLAVDVGTSHGFTNLELLKILEGLMGQKLPFNNRNCLELGNRETFVVDGNSDLFKSGWNPKDSLMNGLEWVIKS